MSAALEELFKVLGHFVDFSNFWFQFFFSSLAHRSLTMHVIRGWSFLKRDDLSILLLLARAKKA